MAIIETIQDFLAAHKNHNEIITGSWTFTDAGLIKIDSAGSANLVLDKGATDRGSDILFRIAGSQRWTVGCADSDFIGDGNDFRIGSTSSNPNIFIKRTTGYVGIWTSTPAKHLHTVGTFRLDSTGTQPYDFTTNESEDALLFQNAETNTRSQIGVLPNGTNETALFFVSNSSDINNGARMIQLMRSNKGIFETVNIGTPGEKVSELVFAVDAANDVASGEQIIFGVNGRYGGFPTPTDLMTLTYDGPQMTIPIRASTIVGLTIRGAASQSADLFQFKNDSAENLVRIKSDGELSLVATAAGNTPKLSFYQTVSERGFIQYQDGAPGQDILEINSDAGINFSPNNTLAWSFSVLGAAILITSSDDSFTVKHSSAIGNPKIRLLQDTIERGFLQYQNTGDILRLDSDGKIVLAANNMPILTATEDIVTIGDGTAEVDYALTFNGEDNEGILTWMEDEDYFKFDDDIYLSNNESLIIDKAAGNGIKVDSVAPTFGWRDLRAEIRTRGVGGTDPNDTIYIGNVKAYSFSVNDEAWIEFHIPHDYATGTDIHLHFHWSHNSAIVTGGSITLGADVTYAKGHDQAAFSATVSPTLSPNASTTQYQHLVSEVQLSAASPGAAQIDTDDLEPDGLILARVYLSANNITSSGAVPDPFIHEVDVHYQSTNIATKDKIPDFYA